MESSKKYVYIGALVISAVFLFVILLTSLGGCGVLSSKVNYTIYFDRSVKGLSVGAPVTFKGIRIGNVKTIRLVRFDDKANIAENGICPVEVVVEIEAAHIENWTKTGYSSMRVLKQKILKQILVEAWVWEMVVEYGMAAQLQTVSLITGQLAVVLHVSGEKNENPEDLVNLEKNVLPVRSTAVDDIYKAFHRFNMTEVANMLLSQISSFVISGKSRKMLENLYSISDGAKIAVNDVKVALEKIKGGENGDEGLSAALVKLNRVLDEGTALISQIKADAAGMSDRINKTLDSTPEMQERLGKSLDRLDRVTENAGQLLEKDGRVDKLLGNADSVVRKAGDAMQEDSPVIIRLEQTLDELDRTMRSLRELTDMLERRPEVLIRGK